MSIWLSVSWKTVVLDLKPTVLALAMLLPVTSSMVWLTRRPLMPAKSERSMVVPLVEGGAWAVDVVVLPVEPVVVLVVAVRRASPYPP